MIDRKCSVYDGTELLEVTYREVDWDEVRRVRDAYLVDSDWRAGKDVVLSTQWREYRQALRDLPQDHAEANDAADNWPVRPDE